MRLDRLQLQNFRCFENLSINFDRRLTVIVGTNGAGKTAILDAIALGLSRYLRKIPGVDSHSTKQTDLHLNAKEQRSPFLLAAWTALFDDDKKITWAGARRQNSTVTPLIKKKGTPALVSAIAEHGMRAIEAYASSIVSAGLEDKPYFLPVVAYYGTNRAIREEVQRRRNFKKQFSRFEALSGALDADSRFRSAFEWFNAKEDEERREREIRRNFDYQSPELEAVRTAIVRMLPTGFSRPRTELRPLRFVIDRRMPDGGIRTLRIAELSDGFRVMLGLTMDLARRMVQANSGSVPEPLKDINPLDLPAIALIDEVDLHLHPEWQQRVLTDLMQTFRGTQFIVTTHSPQVLTSVDASCIRRLGEEIDPDTDQRSIVVRGVELQTKGVASSDLLAEIMGVNPIPDVSEARWVSDYHALIQQNLHGEAQGQTLRTQLEAHFGINHPVLHECDRMIRLQTFKQKLPRNLPAGG